VAPGTERRRRRHPGAAAGGGAAASRGQELSSALPVERCQVDLPVGIAFRLRELRWGRGAATRIERFESIHWDTPDLRLAGWDAGLRYRRGRGWRVTLAGWPEAGAFRRVFVDLEGGQSAPPAEALRLLSPYLRGAEVQQVARLRHLETARRVGELWAIHQVVSLLVDRHAVAHARRVSVRSHGPLGGERRALAALRKAGVEGTTPQSLIAELVGAAAPRWRERPLDRESTVTEAVSAALRDYAARLVRNEAIVLEGSDPEGVHQARVACRRYRSALQTFAPVLEPAWTAELRDELGTVATDLGAVRDTEVLLMRLRTSAAARGVDGEATERLLSRLVGERVLARDVLISVIESDEHRELLERLLAAAAQPAVLPATAGQPASAVLLPLMEASWRKLARRVRRLDARPSDDDLHQVRIAAKKCRYAVLALVPLLGEGPARTGARLGALQDALGEQHDAVVAGSWLQDAVLRAADPETAFTAGVLYGAERERAEAGREAWQESWRALDRRKGWGWM
jgi:CHAD domain-containing protein